MPQFTESDVGKPVVNPVGDEVGLIDTVVDGTAYVDPHPDWGDRLTAQLGWTDDPDMSEQPLETTHVAEITAEHVRLTQDLHVDQTGTT